MQLSDPSKGLLYAQPRFPIAASLYRTVRYYLGRWVDGIATGATHGGNANLRVNPCSVAFGSLLIALIQFIRAVLAYFQRQVQKVEVLSVSG